MMKRFRLAYHKFVFYRFRFVMEKLSPYIVVNHPTYNRTAAKLYYWCEKWQGYSWALMHDLDCECNMKRVDEWRSRYARQYKVWTEEQS